MKWYYIKTHDDSNLTSEIQDIHETHIHLIQIKQYNTPKHIFNMNKS